ncbi:MAG: trypsin-like serine protease [Alphaproteobacteria bacterium]|nr:trypsin-like serine protease [Alphaproteobacteria bacterium]
MLISNPTFRAQKAQVMIYTFTRQGHPSTGYQYIQSGNCSGTMLETDFVLTAAHCISVQSGSTWTWDMEPRLVVVCSKGNLAGGGPSCASASDVVVNPAWYANNGKAKDDWGVIHLESNVVASTDTMYISNAGPSVWDSYYHRHMAYGHGRMPGFSSPGVPTCTLNQASSQFSTWTNDLSEVLPLDIPGGQLGGRNLFRDTRFGDTEYTSYFTKTRFDAAPGSSGSAYFFCPGEDCNNQPGIIGLHTAYRPWVTHSHLGPRAENFKSWVESNAPP